MAVKPYKDSAGSKKQQVEMMFDNISHRYDFLNHFLSLSLDKWWRKRAIRELAEERVREMLDVATGTGDMVAAALKLKPDHIVGIDLSEGMLEIARKKEHLQSSKVSVEFLKGDSEDLPFANHSFDAVTVAFGVRNFEDPLKGLSEINRVLRPGKKLVVLEFSKPDQFPMKQMYNFYFKRILPLFGKMISKDQEAYTYLPESVLNFPEKEDFIGLMKKAGFRESKYKRLTSGIVSIYTGVK
ncbi:MAG TPA: bifunctional demethylmenaquinone methyltransferase/2-methoxy-6-polyprenyl-1,4-benzoquinol methylase UbiE [Prolixibacteraceae bacterium]|nr:bifunctional demethylmenaquinone methyltransferase/2-methoxy-6-polyprenyl-1,4-benzoquinol methylase UbiE [Prolixibacteraceae bacterium]